MQKRIKLYWILLTIVISLASCNWVSQDGPIVGNGPCDASSPVIVYKTKQNYDDKLTVQLSKNGKEVVAYPGKQDAEHQKPIILENGYRLKGMVGDTYLSITIDEYINSDKDFSGDDFLKLIIDNDPYLEKYECCECTGMDTSKINQLIRENRLAECEDLN